MESNRSGRTGRRSLRGLGGLALVVGLLVTTPVSAGAIVDPPTLGVPPPCMAPEVEGAILEPSPLWGQQAMPKGVAVGGSSCSGLRIGREAVTLGR